MTCSGSSPSTGTPFTSTSLSPAYSNPTMKTNMKTAAGVLSKHDLSWIGKAGSLHHVWRKVFWIQAALPLDGTSDCCGSQGACRLQLS